MAPPSVPPPGATPGRFVPLGTDDKGRGLGLDDLVVSWAARAVQGAPGGGPLPPDWQAPGAGPGDPATYFKVFLPRPPPGREAIWAWHWTHKRQGEEGLVYLPADEWTIADVDGNPHGGSPRGVLAEVRTLRGWQWVYPAPFRDVARADQAHRKISLTRGWFAFRVADYSEPYLPRALRPGPCVWATGPGAATYRRLAAVWTAAGGIAEPLPDVPRRRAGCPAILGRLD